MSQNCVCRSAPPGELKQHKSATAEVLWQDNWVLVHVADAPTLTLISRVKGFFIPRTDCAEPSAESAMPERVRMEGMLFARLDQPESRYEGCEALCSRDTIDAI